MNHKPCLTLEEALKEVLTAEGIAVGSLRLVGHRNNDAYTDFENVFCKVTPVQMPPVGIDRELKFVKAYQSKIKSFTPLTEKVLKINLNKVTQFVSVWGWEENVTPLMLKDLSTEVAQQMAEGLNAIHRLPAHDFIEPINSNAVNHTLSRRLRFASTHNPSQKHVELLTEMFHKFIIDANWNFKSMVVNHGDAHVGNFVCNTEGYHWIDFESVRLAPQEWDLATLSLMARRFSSNQEIWETIVECCDRENPVDFDLLTRFETIKALSTTSYLLLHPQSYPLFEERVDALAPLLKGGPFPDRLSMHIPSIRGL